MPAIADLNGEVWSQQVTNAEQDVTKDSLVYTVKHTGFDSAGVASTVPVVCRETTGVVNSLAGGNKFILTAGEEIVLPHEWREFYFICSAALGPVLTFKPVLGVLDP